MHGQKNIQLTISSVMVLQRINDFHNFTEPLLILVTKYYVTDWWIAWSIKFEILSFDNSGKKSITNLLVHSEQVKYMTAFNPHTAHNGLLQGGAPTALSTSLLFCIHRASRNSLPYNTDLLVLVFLMDSHRSPWGKNRTYYILYINYTFTLYCLLIMLCTTRVSTPSTEWCVNQFVITNLMHICFIS
jgi:hypothetical protein